MSAPAPCGRIDVEFSLALHEKTGKYFIGRDLIAAAPDLVQDILYWRLARRAVPTGIAAKGIGRLLSLEANLRVRMTAFDRAVPRLRRPRVVLHMDPYSVSLHRLGPDDIVLCHDVGPLTHGDLFDAPVVRAYHKAYVEIVAARPHMVFVSRASQSAFHALFGEAFASSRVIYPALRAEVATGPRAPAAGVSRPFLLTVGSIGARKNQARAVEAFARSGLASQGMQYVLCGAREPGWETVAALAARTPGVVLFGYVGDATLNWLYANAAGFVLPSRLEGFGIPVAEAIERSLIPVVSQESVLQEVAGEGALPVDPADVDQIAVAMRTLAAMPADEAARRRESMKLALGRFSAGAFAGGWREVIQLAASAVAGAPGPAAQLALPPGCPLSARINL